VLAWVKEDEAARKAELDRLLPLVRFPLMVGAPAAIMADPLVSQHPLGIQLMYEATPGFAKSEKAADCPRLRHRGGLPAQAARNPELLALLELPAGAAPGAVCAALNQKNMDGDLPIHRAVRLKATGLELVRAMIDAGGETMLGVLDNNKRLPLHRAASNSRFPAVVALLLARGPAGSARAETAGGCTPLSYAEHINTGPGAAEIKALLRAATR
jgi:hypothetical protein